MEPGTTNEDPNDLHWKNKLENVSSLPGEILTDKNTAWEKLYSRLRQKPRRVTPVWYWAAAASLLMIMMVTLLMPGKEPARSVKNNTVKTQPVKTVVPGILISKENTMVVVSSSLTGKKKTSETTIKTDHKKFHEKDIIKKEEPVAVNPLEQEYVQQPPAIVPVVTDNDVVTELAVAPVKKKLKVIHINELGDPGDETPNIARSYDHHSFQLKLINQEVYTSPSLPSNYTGFNIFKTKIPPSN